MRTSVVARLALALAALVALPLSAAGPQLLTPVPGSTAKRAIAGIGSLPTPVQFNAASMKALRHTDEFELSLPNGIQHSYVLDLQQDHGAGVTSFVGRHKTLGNSHRVIITSGPSGSFASLTTPEGEFRLMPGPGHDWLVDMTAEQEFIELPKGRRTDALIPPTQAKALLDSRNEPTVVMAVPGMNVVSTPKATPTPTHVIDIMFVYTNRLLQNSYGNNLATLQTRLNFLVTRANTSYADSEVALMLRLVGQVGVNYLGNDSGNALNEITPGCTGGLCGTPNFNAAIFGGVETQRNALGADVVAMLMDGSGGTNSGNGIAWIGGPSPNANFTYSVTQGCTMACESVFIHEVGHNFGLNHDPATVRWQDGGTPTLDDGPSYPYSFGYAFCKSGLLNCNPLLVNGSPGSPPGCTNNPECSTNDGNNFRDLMAYFFTTTSGSRQLYRFSNPNQSDCRAPAGEDAVKLCGVAGLSDTAQALNNNRAAYSGIKASTVGSMVQFATSSVSAAEGTSATLSVSRTGSSSGAISVAYNAVSGTATSGVDFTATGGTLNWIDGDTANKTITVPITNDGVGEQSEVFTVVLSNPLPNGGANGATLGAATTAAVLIPAPYPPGGMIPSGFVTPDGSAGAWTVVTDQAFEGANSIGSAKVLAATQGVFVNSDLRITGTFTAGTVAFAYRVSSMHLGFSELQFSIDGVNALVEPGGESDWKIISVPITAGSHTLRWRFRNALNFPCANVAPPNVPPGGANCADRAWIDAVAMPMGSVISMGAASQSVAESGGTATIMVTRGGVLDGAASVNYATANNTAVAPTHYTNTSGTLNWAAGDGDPKSINVPIIDDTAANPARMFSVALSGPSGASLIAPSSTTVTITDDDNTLQFSSPTYNVTEGAPTVTINVTRLGGAAAPASVTWTTANGTAIAGQDFGTLGSGTQPTGVLNWAGGDGIAKSFTVPILNDTTIESAKTFSVNLSNPTGAGTVLGAQASAAVTINDDDAGVSFAQASYSVIEGGPNIIITVNRTGSTANAIGVTWTTANGSAVAGSDFGTPGSAAQRTGTLTWAAGDGSSRSYTLGAALTTVPVINDSALESTEDFTIVLSNPTGGAALGEIPVTTVSITDNESTFQFAGTALTVGETGANGTLTVTRTGSTATAASVNFTTATGTATAASDFTQTTGTIMWAAGDASAKTIAVGPTAAPAPYIRVLNDALIESPETFTVVLSAPTGGGLLGANTTATVTIASEDAGLSMATATQSVAEAAGTVAVIVNRAGSAAGPLSVNFTTVNGSALAGTHYTATTGTLNWADGDATPKTITVPVIDNTAVNANRTFNVTLSGPVGAALGNPVATVVTIADDDNTLQFTAGIATVAESAGNLVLTVSRLGGAAGAASVAWSTANGTATSGSDFGVNGVPGNVTGTLNWAAGDAANKTITIPILNDAVIESPEAFTVNLSGPTGAGTSLGAIASVAVTLNDDDVGVSFAQAAYTVVESGPNITVTVNRTGSTAGAIGVTWTTANGTAVAGQDYGTSGNPAQRTGVLSWAGGDATAKSFTVGPTGTLPIINDTVVDAGEAFAINLSNPTGGAALGAIASATVNITDDESTIQFSGTALSVGETGANGVLTLTRTGSTATAATVTFTTVAGTALAASDFTQTVGTVTWPAGDSSPRTIAVGPVVVAAPFIRVLNDALIESPETFNVVLSAPTGGGQLGANTTATVTINSEDAGIAMGVATQSVAEAAGNAVVTVNRAGATTGAISVNYATANGSALAGTHYTATTGTLNWADGDATPKTITVPVIDNTAVNANRTFNVTLSAPVGAALGNPVATVVTIADDDNTLQFTAATASVSEATPSLTLTVSRLGGTAGTASVTWSTANGTAVSGSDFGTLGVPGNVTGTLNWAPGDAASKTITIPILNDAAIESTESFTVALSAPVGTGVSLGAVATNTVTINDDEASLNLAQATYSVIESGPNVIVTVNRSGATTGAVSVTWTTGNGTAIAGQDFGTAGNVAQRTGVLSWAAGDGSPKSISVGPGLTSVPIINDTAFEGDETFTITLSNPTGGAQLGPTAVATVTIVDNESSFQFSPATATVGETGANTTLTVTRTGSFATAATVAYTTANGTALAASDFTQTTGVLSWAAGDGAPKTIAVGPTVVAAPFIRVLNDALIESPETFTVALSAPTGGAVLGATPVATVTIDSEDAGIAMAVATQSVAEAAGNAVVTVNRAGATTGAISVNYATANGSALAGTHYTATTGTLNWAAGDGTPRTITVPIVDNTAVNANRTFNVTLSGPVGAALGTPAATVVTIADDDNTLQFTTPTATVVEGVANLVLTVSRLGGAAGVASVTWTTANGTALSGTDFGAAGIPADVTGTLNWAAGDAVAKTVTIPILNDDLVEGAKTFTVNLSAPTGTGAAIGANPTATITLNDNDAGVVLSNTGYLVNENTASITLTVNRIGPTTAAASVTWTTANGSATSGEDFGLAGNAANRTGVLSWGAGDATPRTFAIPILNDALPEGLETFTVALTNPSASIVLGTPATATVTILDDETPPLSTLQFSAPKTVIVEGTGPALLSVTRTGSDFGYPVSVNFAMAAGTALSGSDYTASVGSLSWPAGDSTPRTITVPITNDAVAENPEQFTVTLSAVTPGAGLGTPAVAVVAVIDDDEAFPLDGGIPAGWFGSTGPGIGGSWHVSNDPGAFEGVYALRSDLINDSEEARISVTGSFLAGTLTFRVRVSSEPNFDFMRFYVDGVKIGEWSGTASANTWLLVSVPVAAGIHTFRWSYEKDASEAFGQDAAWIDSVVLPPPGP